MKGTTSPLSWDPRFVEHKFTWLQLVSSLLGGLKPKGELASFSGTRFEHMFTWLQPTCQLPSARRFAARQFGGLVGDGKTNKWEGCSIDPRFCSEATPVRKHDDTTTKDYALYSTNGALRHRPNTKLLDQHPPALQPSKHRHPPP